MENQPQKHENYENYENAERAAFSFVFFVPDFSKMVVLSWLIFQG